MDIFVSRQPQERLYLVQYDPKKDTPIAVKWRFSAGQFVAPRPRPSD